jgi:hypothetical protein
VTTNEVSAIRSGTVLIHDKAVLPGGIEFRTQPIVPGWHVIRDRSSADLDRAIAKAGWHFFYLAEELEESALGRSPGAALKKAVQKLATRMERDHRNALEITDIRLRPLLGLCYARLRAHPRHVKKTPFLVDGSENARLAQPPGLTRAQAA